MARGLLLSAACLLLAPAAWGEEKDNYAAVAYSTRTGEHWIVYGMPTKEKAEEEVTKRIKEREGLTVVVVKNCYVSLAMSKDGKAFAVGEADGPLEAGRKALAECRKQSKLKCNLVVTLHAGQGVEGDAFSAIAYSPTTGSFGFALAKASKSEAELEAIEKCEAKDAKVVASTKNNCCALAVGKDKAAFGVGIAIDEKEAQKLALQDCEKKTSDSRIVVTLSGKKQ